jgi:hypothetical protein
MLLQHTATLPKNIAALVAKIPENNIGWGGKW